MIRLVSLANGNVRGAYVDGNLLDGQVTVGVEVDGFRRSDDHFELGQDEFAHFEFLVRLLRALLFQHNPPNTLSFNSIQFNSINIYKSLSYLNGFLRQLHLELMESVRCTDVGPLGDDDSGRILDVNSTNLQITTWFSSKFFFFLILVFIFKFYCSKNTNLKLKFGHGMQHSKSHWMMSKSFRYFDAFFGKLKKIVKNPRKIRSFCDWTISLRNYFSRPMKLEDQIVQ